MYYATNGSPVWGSSCVDGRRLQLDRRASHRERAPVRNGALTSRYDEDSDFEGAFEAMLVHGRGGSFYAVQRSQAYRDVWRAPSGRIYVAAYTQMAWSDTPTQGGGGWMAPGSVVRMPLERAASRSRRRRTRPIARHLRQGSETTLQSRRSMR